MVAIYDLRPQKLETETEQEFICRLCLCKDSMCLSWKDIASIVNNELGIQHSESWYRKNYQKGAFFTPIESVTTATDNTCDGQCEACDNWTQCASNRDTLDEAIPVRSPEDEKLHQLMLKKVEVSDMITQNKAYIRRLSREQTIKDIAHDYAQIMSRDKILETPQLTREADLTNAEGVLLLSDWHYGMVCDNPWNQFDPDVCRERVNKLLNKTVKIVSDNNLDKVHVLDLADLIAGRIHTQIRIESRFDVITQTMQVAEILAEFLNELSNYCEVSFYSCLDNHSRLEPNKKESMDLESLARLIPWYLVERLKDNDCVQICDNKYGADIITCTVAGHSVIGVHGDNDKPTTALERLSLMTHQHYDMLCTAHLHHMALEEQHQSMVVSNGCLMGVDRYAEKLRLTSDPSQTFIIATPDNVCECIYRLKLN